ncbi:MAG: family transporter protein [Planctomycetaceae bacterium]|nr:family transporter protein [Planctomycetaceae bacterium]
MVNPLIQRELVTLLRRRRMILLQCGLAAAFALLVVIRWPTEPRMAQSGTRAQEVFRLFSYGLLATLLLILPVFPATNIVRERNQGTLALLLNTPLGPGRIYWGKLIGILALAALILVLSLPAAAACYALGGVSLTGGILAVFAVLGLTAAQYASLGLLVSTYATTSDAAVRWTYGMVLASSVFSMGPQQFFQGTGSSLSVAGDWLRCLSPFSALMALQGAGDLAGNGLLSTTNVPGRFAILSVLLTGVYSIWTMSRLNHTIFDQSRAAGKISDDQSLGVRVTRRFMFIVDPQRRSTSIGRFTNPVMMKEFRCRRFGRLHWLLRLVAVCAMLSLGLTYATVTGTVDWGVDMIGGIMVLLQVALLVLITPSLAAGLISTEIESGGWPLLQMTPMSAVRIVWGKLLSVILTLLLVLCATLPGYVVMVYIEPGLKMQVQRIVVCLVATAGFAMLLSAAVGSLFRRTATATAAAYVALLLVCGAPLLIWLGRDAPFGHDTVETVLLINPVAAALSVIRLNGFRDYQLIPGNWWFLGIASAVCLVLLVVRTRRVSQAR